MSIIFQSLGRTVIAGIVILALLLFFAGNGLTNGVAHTIGLRWLHVGCGVMWIGLLWYFNFVQIPSMPKIPDEQKPAISKVIAPAALFWFRWSALATVVTGLLVALNANYLMQALMLIDPARTIGIGMWLALVMAFNVWFIIWPNQKKALGIVVVEAAEKAKAARMAMLTSRFNTMLSIAMLYCMVAQQNGGL
ncbi:MAG: urate hydroxylase PuuD [Rugosibacter sp.]|nr:urate hydroxylase PuuD [Rugosibacter sp.]MDO9273021.1 urate hydroxylase PuuD [Rugosibacter sp.]